MIVIHTMIEISNSDPSECEFKVWPGIEYDFSIDGSFKRGLDKLPSAKVIIQSVQKEVIEKYKLKAPFEYTFNGKKFGWMDDFFLTSQGSKLIGLKR